MRAAVLAGAAMGLWWAFQQAQGQQGTTSTGEDEATQDPAPPLWDLDAITGYSDAFTSTPDPDMADTNTAAFLMAIRYAEGTAGPNGYRTLFGGGLFNGFADHPRVAVKFRDKAGRELWTTAAGAYQAMAVSPLPGGGSTRTNTWDVVQKRLGLPDFSPASQDAFAIELIREAGGLGDVRAGRFDDAIAKVRKIWASLPGAGYAQPERSLDALRVAFVNAGGSIA